MEFWANFLPIILWNNLFSKLFEIGEKLLKNPLSFLAVHKKGSKSNFLEQNTIFFCKRSSLRSQKFLNVSQTCWDPLYYVFPQPPPPTSYVSVGPKHGFLLGRVSPYQKSFNWHKSEIRGFQFATKQLTFYHLLRCKIT